MNEIKIADGYDVTYEDTRGAINAQIYRPRAERKQWALCFARCVGAYAGLQGKYQLHDTKGAAVDAINNATRGTK